MKLNNETKARNAERRSFLFGTERKGGGYMDEVIKELGLIPYEEDVTDEDDAEGVWEDVR